MAIYSNPFGGVRLTGEDAKKFLRQVRYGRPNAAVKATKARIDIMDEKFRKHGGEIPMRLDPKTGKFTFAD